jgi:hypothetical protein
MSRSAIVDEVFNCFAFGREIIITLPQLPDAGSSLGRGMLRLRSLARLSGLALLPKRDSFLNEFVNAAAGARSNGGKASFLIRQQANFHNCHIILILYGR